MIVAIASFTKKGAELAEQLAGCLHSDGHDAAHSSLCRGGSHTGGLAQWTASQFRWADALVFVGAAGIAVRAIAPHVRSKATDPAVVSVDEKGLYAVPLLSGHIGGANDLARAIAGYCGGMAVISTATDLNGVFAVDIWAVKQGLRIVNPQYIKEVSARRLAGDVIVIASSYEITGIPPEGVVVDNLSSTPDVRIRCGDLGGSTLQLVPPAMTLGIGCKKDTTEQVIDALYRIVLKQYGLLRQAVGAVASIDIKAEEPGLLAFCKSHRLPLHCYSAAELRGVAGEFSSSVFVQSVTGVDNVCERAAVLHTSGQLLGPKHQLNGVTMAVAEAPVSLSFDTK